MRRSSSYPWTYVESMVAGMRARNDFDQVHTYCMFIGQPRSGTSLIGSIMNAHRQMLIAQELNALRYVVRGYGKNQLYWLLKMKDQEFAADGRRWTGYQYEVPNQWQSKTDRPFVIGDKKAGLSSEIIAKHPDVLERLQQLVKVPIKIVHIVRNPFNVITTIHRKRSRTPLELAASMYFGRCQTNWQLMQERPDVVKTIRLEDMIAQPYSHLAELCSHVGVDCPDDYAEDCSSILFAKPRQSQKDIVWPQTILDQVTDEMQKYPFLDGYTADAMKAAA
ncbi:MAG: sulfotransferase [Planctomycetales bacterium]|nr:sulfotransferase [Planctomycetales bacterium]